MDFTNIINSHVSLTNFAGDAPSNTNKNIRESLIQALETRKKECMIRFSLSISVICIALFIIVYLSLFKPVGLDHLKKFTDTIGGGSIVALLYYIISLRDEMTKIEQTKIIATVVDDSTLNTMLVAITNK